VKVLGLRLTAGRTTVNKFVLILFTHVLEFPLNSMYDLIIFLKVTYLCIVKTVQEYNANELHNIGSMIWELSESCN